MLEQDHTANEGERAEEEEEGEEVEDEQEVGETCVHGNFIRALSRCMLQSIEAHD